MMIGKILGNRYEILEEIGSGGMANVYKAHCRLLNRQVAVKVLKRELVEDKEYLKRFNVEAQAAASLVHPNIVSIFDFGCEDDNHYIVMELIDGITLKQYINENAPLNTKDALNIAYQICDALSVAHQNKIVHRDIKPHNIMITSDMRVKVTDFGIARASIGSTMTADNNILGSVHYISPEQARGSVVDGKTDLYSLGIVLYEMLTGKVPFECDSPVAIAMKHIEEVAVNPREYNSDITYSVQQLVMKAISKDINERYQNASDFKSDIIRLIENPDAVIDNQPSEITSDNDSTQKIPVTIIENDKPESDDGFKDDEEFEQQQLALKKANKKILIISLITSLVIVGALSIYVSYLLFPNSPMFSMFADNKIEVPDLRELPLEDARIKANDSGFEIEVVEKVVDESVEEGCIISQDPEYGKKAKNGTIIRVVLSVASEKTNIKDYELINYTTAKRDLENNGFVVDCIFEFNDDVPENFVISQDPPSYSEVQIGSPVTLYVSKGPEKTTVTVPKFVGKTLEEAQEILNNEGLVLGEVTYEASVVDEGLIIKQSISGGEPVDENTTINFVVSSGENGESNNGNPNGNQNTEKEKTLRYSYGLNTSATSIRIDEDGVTIFEGLASPDQGDFVRTVTGSGQKTYDIYVDGVYAETQVINFDE